LFEIVISSATRGEPRPDTVHLLELPGGSPRKDPGPSGAVSAVRNLYIYTSLFIPQRRPLRVDNVREKGKNSNDAQPAAKSHLEGPSKPPQHH